MIDSVGALHQLVSAVASQRLPLEMLDHEVANLGDNIDTIKDEALRDRYAKLELLLAEYTSGHVDRDELIGELQVFAPVAISSDVTATYVRVSVATSTQGTIIRQVIEAGPGPSPAAGIRVALVHG